MFMTQGRALHRVPPLFQHAHFFLSFFFFFLTNKLIWVHDLPSDRDAM
jgi:hypothetical protein